jgi:lysophospholipase L1-like esterase
MVKAPWLGWGVYLWSDGSTPQFTNPNVFWNCPGDFNPNDGTHPSVSGAQKVGELLLTFFSSDSTAKIWFLKK